MSFDDKIRRSIEAQFLANGRKNLFYKGFDFKHHFQPETVDVILNHKKELEQINRLNLSKKWIDLMTDIALKTFYASNQFINLNKKQINDLRDIYCLLWKDITNELESESPNYEEIQKQHIKRLSNWLQQTNPFVKEINSEDFPEIRNVVCSEYSALLQMQILRVDISNLLEPVLDIGCGEHSWLVEYLRNLGIDAYGVDRLCKRECSYLIRENWLDYEFKPESWGTILSNLSFTLHFTNHNQRRDGNYIQYAKKYMEILESLKKDGCFHYAPSLPFIETYLPSGKYEISVEKVNDSFASAIVKTMRY